MVLNIDSDDYKFIDDFCENYKIREGEGHKNTLMLFLNSYKMKLAKDKENQEIEKIMRKQSQRYVRTIFVTPFVKTNKTARLKQCDGCYYDGSHGPRCAACMENKGEIIKVNEVGL